METGWSPFHISVFCAMGCLQLYAAKGKRISNVLISLQRFALFSSDGTAAFKQQGLKMQRA